MRLSSTLLGALLGALSIGSVGSLSAGCGDDNPPFQGSPEDAGVDAPPDAYVPVFTDCDGAGDAFVRSAYLAILGHRPRSQAEVDVYTAIYDQVQSANPDGSVDPRVVVARALMKESAYVDRWSSHFMDALRVARIEDQNMGACYSASQRETTDEQLAAYVRDNDGSQENPPGGPFTMLDLLRSSLALDDLTPVYRGHLYTLVSYAIPAANVDREHAELARREDFGLVFDSAYLNRDIVCLGCHNSEASVTNSEDPALDRHWPLAGMLEKSIYGVSSGIAHEVAHAPFRYDGFSAMFDDGGRKPWGWERECGIFSNITEDDPARVDGRFASLEGRRLSVYDLEGILHQGFDTLRGGALTIAPDGTIADPDAAFAYLVSASIVEGVWKEVMGSGLTIANYFPRNQAARDMLQNLTDRFIKSGYSLEALLVDIVSTDYFNRQAPEEGCGAGPYNYPNLYDPWVISDTDEARRQNGSGDSVTALSSRALMRSAYTALEWPVPDNLDFPYDGGDEDDCQGQSCNDLQVSCQVFNDCCGTYQSQCVGGSSAFDDELTFQRSVGSFLKNGERGFRGLDFQARLAWEDRFAACTKPIGSDDYIDRVIAAAQADSSATVGDVVSALKDRIVGEPAIATEGTPSEASAVAGIFGADLDAAASSVTDLDGRARAFCGVLMASPQFLLTGFAGKGGEVPRLTPADAGFDTICAGVADRGLTGYTVTCSAGAITISAAP
jgi:hypothetical protein